MFQDLVVAVKEYLLRALMTFEIQSAIVFSVNLYWK